MWILLSYVVEREHAVKGFDESSDLVSSVSTLLRARCRVPYKQACSYQHHKAKVVRSIRSLPEASSCAWEARLLRPRRRSARTAILTTETWHGHLLRSRQLLKGRSILSCDRVLARLFLATSSLQGRRDAPQELGPIFRQSRTSTFPSFGDKHTSAFSLILFASRGTWQTSRLDQSIPLFQLLHLSGSTSLSGTFPSSRRSRRMLAPLPSKHPKLPRSTGNLRKYAHQKCQQNYNISSLPHGHQKGSTAYSVRSKTWVQLRFEHTTSLIAAAFVHFTYTCLAVDSAALLFTTCNTDTWSQPQSCLLSDKNRQVYPPLLPRIDFSPRHKPFGICTEARRLAAFVHQCAPFDQYVPTASSP